MTDEELPLLAEVFPDLVAEILRLLDPEDTGLVEQIPTLRYYGRCACTPTCPALLTAPQGSPTPYLCELEGQGEPAIWLSLDPTGAWVVDVEVLD